MAILGCLFAAHTLHAAVSIIPMSAKCVEKRGNFTINSRTVISLSTDNQEMRHAVAALAEVGWSKKEHKDYTRFCSRLTKLTQHYDVLGIDYCKEEALKK